MLQVFHQYQKSLLLVLFGIIVCFAMLLFGINPYGDNPQAASALEINGEVVTQQDFDQARSNLEANYQRQFGAYYTQLLEQLNINLTQATIDSIIPRTLLSSLAKKQDLAVSNQQLAENLQNLFGDEFSREAYESYLKNTGQSALGFEQRLKADLLPETLRDLVSNYAVVTESEVDAALITENTTYDLQQINFSKADYLAAVQTPDDQTLQNYFEDNADSYQLPATVNYDYIVIDPAKNLKLVELSADDIELEYADNPKKYRTEEQLTYYLIDLAPDADLSQLSADNVNLTPENFISLVTPLRPQSADAVQTELNKETKPISEVAQPAVKAGAIGQSGVITDENQKSSAFYILEKTEAEPRELDDALRAEIKAALQKRDAPAYVRIYAEDLFAAWEENASEKLTETAEQAGLEIQTSGEAVNPQVPNLERLVLVEAQSSNGDQSKVFIEANNDMYVIAKINDYQAEKIPEFEKTKAKVLADYKSEQAEELMQAAAKQLSVGETKIESVDAAKIENFTDLVASERAAPLNNPEVAKAVAELGKPGLIDQTFAGSQPDTLFVLAVKKISKPDLATLKDQRETKKQQLKDQVSSDLMRELVAKLKADAEIEIAPSLS